MKHDVGGYCSIGEISFRFLLVGTLCEWTGSDAPFVKGASGASLRKCAHCCIFIFFVDVSVMFVGVAVATLESAGA